MSYDDDFSALAGKNIDKVYMNEDYLIFVSGKEVFAYTVEGDCCSSSYFHDFVGVQKVLENGEVISTRALELDEFTGTTEQGDYDDCIKVYGYEIVTEHWWWGPQTSVVTFRNASNGYYGGWMNTFVIENLEEFLAKIPVKELTDDVLGG